MQGLIFCFTCKSKISLLFVRCFIYAYIHVCIYICICICVCGCGWVCVCVRARAYVCMYVYIMIIKWNIFLLLIRLLINAVHPPAPSNPMIFVNWLPFIRKEGIKKRRQRYYVQKCFILKLCTNCNQYKCIWNKQVGGYLSFLPPYSDITYILRCRKRQLYFI